MRIASLVVLLAATLARAQSLPVEPPPPAPPAGVARSVRLVKLVDGLEQPVALTYAPGDSERRLFVVEKGGLVRVLRNGKLARAGIPSALRRQRTLLRLLHGQ
jgi:hypothetical protein